MIVLQWHFRICLIVFIEMISTRIEARMFDRCDLARTLRYKHNLSLPEVNVWACIAQYQSGYNTEAVGYDSNGIGYYGMFQISDRYWCSTYGAGNSCDISCSHLLDDDLTDDLKCVRKIFEEHQRLSGDGYNAWSSYKNTCQYVYEGLFTDDCFVGDVDYIQSTFTKTTTTKRPPQVVNSKGVTSTRNRIYNRCELARELWYVHQIPADQIATWVCIAKHESNFNTSAIGGRSDHGLFQISDIYWCSPPGRGWVCGLSCAKLEDSDITDDVECMKKIYDEHQRLFGDGFNAWSVYRLHCKDRSEAYIKGCFDDSDSNSVVPYSFDNELRSATTTHVVKIHPTKVKIYERCELARELYEKHKVPKELLANYVCIAYYESKYNTSAVGHLNSDESGDHGLFQISDIYWCSPPGNGNACGLSCAKLEDADITDDVECMRKIYDEHQRLSGDGFNAWSVYNPSCKDQSNHFVDGCFDEIINSLVVPDHRPAVKSPKSLAYESKRGKIFQRCELANQLRFKYDIPIDQISTWLCIAQHESNYNTSAVVHNTVESENHGLFQISDIYWCSPPGIGWACGLSCAKLEDSDITDDVECIKKIYEEHQRLFDDGFNAWASYKRHCHESTVNFAEDCFQDAFDRNVISSVETQPEFVEKDLKFKTNEAKGKVYERCELARELKDVHNISIDEISIWVCIGYHESSYNTAAVGRLNTDGSGDHGLFQISDIYWCSLSGRGKACGLSCSDLENSNITDDVQCIRQIFEEHTRISGDGFNAWSVYEPYCKERASQFIDGCFEDDTNSIYPFNRRPGITSPTLRSNRRTSKANIRRGKVYDQCELALELRDKYKISEAQIATWVCIAMHESSLNTSAVGRNADGSRDHGIFQISDIYWCSPPGVRPLACGLTCSEFEDSDIGNDVECMKKIYDEHQTLSGDGFNAWSVYKPKCKGKSKEYIKRCFDGTSEIPATKRAIENTTVTPIHTFRSSIRGEIPTTTLTNLGKYTPRTIVTPLPFTESVTTTTKSTRSTMTSSSSRNDITVFPSSRLSETFPTTVYKTMKPITNKQSSTLLRSSSSASVTNPTFLSSTTQQSERSRIQSIFDIYFNGFKTPRPTTRQFIIPTRHHPEHYSATTPTVISLSQSYGNGVSGSTQPRQFGSTTLKPEQSFSVFETEKPLRDDQNNLRPERNPSLLSFTPTRLNTSAKIQTTKSVFSTKRRSGFRFGLNVPTESLTYPQPAIRSNIIQSDPTYQSHNYDRKLNSQSDIRRSLTPTTNFPLSFSSKTIGTTRTLSKSTLPVFNYQNDYTTPKSSFLLFSHINSTKLKKSSSDATTMNSFIRHYTTATVTSKTTSQRPSSTTLYSFPTYNSNRLTTTTTKSPSINHFINTTSQRTFNSRFTRAPNINPKLTSSNRLNHHDHRITTQSPFDQFFDLFVH